MFGAIHPDSMKYLPATILLTILLLGLPLSAQFRTAQRSADKAFELHAYHLAIEGYQRALAYRPDDVQTLSRLAEAYRMLNQPDTARYYYELTLNNRRTEPEALLHYAHTLRSLGEYGLALPVYQTYAREGDARIGNHYAASCDFAVVQQNVAAGFAVDAVGVNGPAAEFGANLPLGGQFIFNSARLDEEFSGVATNRPYVATIDADGTLSPTVPVAFSYRAAAGSNGPVSYSPDGSQVLFSRNNFTPGTRMIPQAGITLSLLIADVNEAGEWINVRPLPFNGNAFNTGFGTFGADANTIYFASDRPGGYGGYDIYRARRSGNDWDANPENVGGTVNSVGHEITPFYDGRSLYFSSDFHQGLGDYDVFRAEMEADRPRLLYHMGGAINSSRDDMGFVYDPASGTGYLTSNRGGTAAQEDIYRVKSLTPPVAGELAGELAGGGSNSGMATGPDRNVPEGVSANTPVPFGAVRGYVTDLQQNTPIAGAAVTVTERSTTRATTLSTDTEGAYYVTVTPRAVYDVNVVAEGYETMSFPVTTPTTRDEEAFGNIGLLPVQSSYGNGSETPPVAPPPATVPLNQPEASAPAGVAAAAPAEGYSVQLASVKQEPVLADYRSVASLGPVYSARVDGAYKVRVGPFPTRSAAESAGRQAAALGFGGNFVVRETAATAVVTNDIPDATGRSPYRVQVGAFGKPENFDRERAATLGPLGSELRGTLTIFYIEAPSEARALSIRDRATIEGFTGAYVLKRTGETYEKLRP